MLALRADSKQLAELTHLVEQGKIKPTIDRVFDFADTEQALDYVATGRSKGKVVIGMVDV